jgi:hypothetical protein
MILKMNFNFNFKDSLLGRTRQSTIAQPHVIGITWWNSQPERVLRSQKVDMSSPAATGASDRGGS